MAEKESESAKRARWDKKYRSTTGRAPSFKIELSGGDDVRSQIREKMGKVKALMEEKPVSVNNADVLNAVLDEYIRSHSTQASKNIPGKTNSYHRVDREDIDQPVFFTALHSVDKLARLVAGHVRSCPGAIFSSEEKTRRGHAAIISLTCQACDSILPQWASSPYLPNNKFLVNYRMAHGYFSSGMLYSQYERLCHMADIGYLTASYIKDNMLGDVYNYNAAVSEVYTSACERALEEEISRAKEKAKQEDQPYKGISIITDARHGWRKNSRQTDVVCIGYSTHQVITDEIVTTADDPCAQRHEKIGTARIYSHLSSHPEGPVEVAIHAHDRNQSVNKYVRDEHPETKNQNDTWHAGKSVEKELAKITKGAVKAEGRLWHTELSDKASSIRTHVAYAIRNCQQDSAKLRDAIDNVVCHYQNQHDNCFPESRCRSEPGYEPSKLILRSEAAIGMLRNALHQTVVYKSPADFVHAMDTFYVESFNNVLNMWHDKRIVFESEEYTRRSQMAVTHWNENVNRPYTSIWTPPIHSVAPNIRHKQSKCKKNYKKQTFQYCWDIWNIFINQVYEEETMWS